MHEPQIQEGVPTAEWPQVSKTHNAKYSEMQGGK